MKDAYSFHATPECAAEWYQRTCAAYAAILSRLCPPGAWVQARGAVGAMGGSTSHEWLLLSAEGEDLVAGCPACGHRNAELPAPHACSQCPPPRPALELGHTFALGTRYSAPMALRTQHTAPVLMGCYGLGISRMVPALLGAWGGHYPPWLRPYAATLVPSPKCAAADAERAARVLAAQLGGEVLLWDDAVRGGRVASQEVRVERARLVRCGEPWQCRADGGLFRVHKEEPWDGLEQ